MSKHHLVETRLCHRSTGSWRFEFMVSAIAIALAFAIACNKTPSEKTEASPAAVASEAAVKPAAHSTDTKNAALEKLAADYHTVRCVLIGAKIGGEKLYSELGYDDVQAFNKAFGEAAKRDPSWAKATLAASYGRSCQESQP